MTRTVVALYDDFAHANEAVRELVDAGFSRSDLSIMANDASGQYSSSLQSPVATTDTGKAESGASQGAGVGAGIGAVLGGIGGLLVGLGALTIPGIGPVLAAGPLSAALAGLAGAGVGAVAGGVTGGLIGALTDMGVPEESAQYYAEGIRRGGTLVTLQAGDDMTQRAVDIFNRHNPVDINRRASQWRESGWTRFDPNAPAATATTTARTENEWPQTDQTRMGGADYADSRMNEGQRLPGAMNTDFSSYDTDFRRHFESLSTSGYTYDQYAPAYRYGYDLASDNRYQDYDWDRLEPEARRYWDERNPGSWERFKDAVRYAWAELKDSVS